MPPIVLKTGELFAGVGGLSLGFLLAGHPRVRFQPLFALDADEHAITSYRTNMQWLAEHAPAILPSVPAIYPQPIEALDVEATLLEHHLERGELDILLGGPPCQGLSSANRQTEQQRRAELNNLMRAFLEKVVAFRPKMFLIENVQGVRWTPPTAEMQGEPIQAPLFPDMPVAPADVREFIIQSARSLGYKVWHDIIDAADFGIPQRRKRFFLFGIREDVFPRQHVELTPLLRLKRCAEPVTVMQAIGDLPALGNGQRWTEGEYHVGDSDYIRWLRRYMENGDLHDHFTTNHKDFVIERFERIPEGGNWENIRDMMTTYSDVERTHSNIYRRLIGTAPAHTISHYRKSMIVHPQQHRGLSFREACRLQSFPDWFRFHGPRDEGMQQHLANAVPPLLAAAVAWAIGEFWWALYGEPTADPTPLEPQ